MLLLLHQFGPNAPLISIITSLKGDIVAWAVLFLGVELVIVAYRQVQKIVQEGEVVEEDCHRYSEWGDSDDDSEHDRESDRAGVGRRGGLHLVTDEDEARARARDEEDGHA
jgi:hypothetical protein